jgi:hypothetical protein
MQTHPTVNRLVACVRGVEFYSCWVNIARRKLYRIHSLDKNMAHNMNFRKGFAGSSLPPPRVTSSSETDEDEAAKMAEAGALGRKVVGDSTSVLCLARGGRERQAGKGWWCMRW